MPRDQPRDQRVLSKEAVAAALASPNPVRPVPPAPTWSGASKPAESRDVAPLATYYGCEYLYLCMFADSGFSGYRIRFYDCIFVDLGGVNYPLGGKWNDRVTSYVNNQSPGTVGRAYNWNGSSFVQLFATEALDWNGNIGIGWNYNDMIDGVRAC
ncbi:peptidase inhibitor family I36 protein [Micromonospora matsumotoense]|uniref:peptidase inhibitor family I36 protein n=1 Tax=Micromonospora matsumotoense TaxID=121616 RepID=UPI00114C922C